jgi:hypothetical protein
MHLTYERSLTKEIQSINNILCNPNNPYLCTKVRKLPRSRSRTRRLYHPDQKFVCKFLGTQKMPAGCCFGRRIALSLYYNTR